MYSSDEDSTYSPEDYSYEYYSPDSPMSSPQVEVPPPRSTSIKPTRPPPRPVPPPAIPEPAIAICHSVGQAKDLIHNKLGIQSPSLRTQKIPGIVILSVRDLNLIRNDSRNNRSCDNILVINVGGTFEHDHPDLAEAIRILNP